jgi:endonuclease YncB( thermonuclease family)
MAQSVKFESGVPEQKEQTVFDLTQMNDTELSGIALFPNKYWGQKAFCRFTDYYDGDTATIVFVDNDTLTSCKFRFYGYDSPEIKVPKKIQGDERIKRKTAAYAAKNHLMEFLDTKFLVVHFTNTREKWGRLLGEVYFFDKESKVRDIDTYECDDTNSVSHYMVHVGHGYNYYGGTKRVTQEWASEK